MHKKTAQKRTVFHTKQRTSVMLMATRDPLKLLYLINPCHPRSGRSCMGMIHELKAGVRWPLVSAIQVAIVCIHSWRDQSQKSLVGKRHLEVR